jgi:hypothetical protein
MMKATSWFAGLSLVCLLLTSSFFLAQSRPSFSESSAGPIKLTPPDKPIPREFFGLHIHRAFGTTPWPPVPFGSWRLWDAKVHWPQVETARNEWNWGILDREVELAEKHHVDLLLPFGETPEWAVHNRFHTAIVGDIGDLEDWRTFIRTQAERYKGRILYYEIWNEPNLPRNRDIGPPPRMLELAREAYATLKQVDPDIKVISPSPVNPNGLDWMERYFELGGAKYADIIGYHFYVYHRPESMLNLILPAKEIMRKYGLADKPLWNTESGWIRNPLTDRVDLVEQAPGWAARAYILNWAAGVDRFYWYAWDDDGHDVIPFTEEDQATITNSARAYGEIQKWLVGARMESCERQADENWVCKLTRESGRSAWILWNEEHGAKFDVPKSWEVTTLTKLSGEQSPWSASKIDLGELPIMLEGPPAHR